MPPYVVSPSSRLVQRSIAHKHFTGLRHMQFSGDAYVYRYAAPTTSELLGTLDFYAIPRKIYRDPHYSRATDAPERPREYAGLVYHLKGGAGLSVLDPWDGNTGQASISFARLEPSDVFGWEFASCAPSVKAVKQWLRSNAAGHVGEHTYKITSQVTSLPPQICSHD